MLFVPKWLYRSAPPATADDDDGVQPETIADRLQHYQPHGERPPSSRIDPKLEQREFQGRTLADIFRYGVLIATKATDVASDMVRHKLVGARKPSWGIEMTIISAFMRNIGNNTSLADIPMLRAVMALSGYGPLPSDAIVTPVTFRARRRNLRGFLADPDAKEDGTRILSAEWVIGKRLWLRLQEEWRKAKIDANGKRPRHHNSQRTILFLHGGAFYVSSAAAHRPLTIPLSKYTDARIFALDYRLAPETRFPGQLHDAVLAYLRVVEDLHIPTENLIVCGDSAGGGLAMALLLYLRDNKYPLPAAAILMSPWVDMTMSCDSWDSNAQFDLVPTPLAGDHLNPILCFLGPEGVAKHLTHPYASPLFGAMEGLPPLLIQTGDAEVLRDESMLLAHKATLAGVNVRHEIYEDQVHVFQALSFLEAATKAMISCREFVNIHLSRKEGAGAKEMEKEAEASLAREIDSQAARIVNGDGTVVDDKRPSDLPPSSRASTLNGTTDEGSSSSDLEPSWAVDPKLRDPHIRDGTSVNMEGDEEVERPESPISLKPKRRSPHASSNHVPTLKTTPTSPTSPARSYSFYSTKSQPSPSESGSGPKVLAERNGNNSNLTRRRTHLNLNLTSNPPTSYPAQLSPSMSMSMPSVRRRERATSHPDIFQLCQSWAESGPANDPVRIDAHGNTES